MDDYQKLIEFGNLYNSYLVSVKGTRRNVGAARFENFALENICIIQRQLKDRSYKISPYYEFEVSEPKKRIIKCGSFRDKVLQHCLCDHVLIPKMEQVFIEDNYAGRIGKGTLFGLNRLSEHLQNFYSEFGCNGYILKCDITKFFYSINHDIMKQELRKYVTDDGILWVCDLFIDSTDGLGLPLGNQLSQVFALIYLNGLDYLITRDLKCTYYGRYMDDFYIISNDKAYLQKCKDKIEEHLSSLGLTLNNKTEIVPISKGIRFLGFHTYLTNNGKVIRKLNGANKRQAKKKFRKYAQLVKKGKMDRSKFDEIYGSWKNHILHGNCFKLSMEMDKYIDQLLDEYRSETRIIVSGGRDFADYDYLKEKMNGVIENINHSRITIISGGAKGADSIAEKYAREKGIEFKRFNARWDLFGKRAGYIRNIEMLDYAGLSDGDSILVAFWDGKSNGTKHMISEAMKRENFKVYKNFYKNLV